MVLYQITKYNPEFRDYNGRYMLDDWTSISDIGKIFNGKIFEIKEYMVTENAYIEAIKLIVLSKKVETLYINGLEKYFNIADFNNLINKYPEYYPDKLTNIFQSAKEGLQLNHEDIQAICRLVLREHLWCNLCSKDDGFKIFFGYDYYMKIECEGISEETFESIKKVGLYVEVIDNY